MRKFYVLSFLLLILVTKSFGQISLVNSINESSEDVSKFTNIDGSIGFIVLNDSSELTVYNEDFSLNRTIKLNIPNFKCIGDISRYNKIVYDDQLIVSTHLFNDNGAIEFIISLNDKSSGKQGFAIVDEYSHILFSKYSDILDTEFIFHLMTTSNKIYLLVDYYSSQSSKTEIYSLPGSERFDWCSSSSSISDVKSVISKSKVYPFPNPAHTTVNLSYILPKGSQGTLSVYDLNGKCLKTMKVDGAFPHVALDVSGYEPSTYVYTVESNGTSVSSKFIVSR